MSHYILSIDIGTTSAKALAVLQNGQVISTLQQFYPTHYPQPDFAEQDPDVLVKAVDNLLSQSIKSLSDHSLRGIVLSCAMHGIMAVDELGNAATPLIIWADTRSKNEARQLKSTSVGNKIYKRTGTPIHPMSPLCKLMWMKKYQPELFDRASKFISLKEYVLHHWTGEYAIDYSIASATGMFDIQSLSWCDEALNQIPLAKEKLSKPVSTRTVFQFSDSVAEQFGVSKETPIIIGASDGCLAQVGSQAMQEGDLTITLGTSGAVRVARSKFKLDEQQRIFSYWLDDQVFICGGATNNGTALLSWYSKTFAAAADIQKFVEEVSDTPAGSDGLIVLPYWLGERAPLYNPDARGVFYGVSMHHTQKHFQRALLEGICFELRSIVESLEQVFGTQKRILVSGGIIRSREWLQMLGDVLGRTLLVADDHDASALGAARWAFETLGFEMESSQTATQKIDPNSNHHKVYEKSYILFKKLNQQMESVFNDTANR